MSLSRKMEMEVQEAVSPSITGPHRGRLAETPMIASGIAPASDAPPTA
jgi:hypothetical protein